MNELPNHLSLSGTRCVIENETKSVNLFDGNWGETQSEQRGISCFPGTLHKMQIITNILFKDGISLIKCFSSNSS